MEVSFHGFFSFYFFNSKTRADISIGTAGNFRVVVHIDVDVVPDGVFHFRRFRLFSFPRLDMLVKVFVHDGNRRDFLVDALGFQVFVRDDSQFCSFEYSRL